jgi:hypothetical protein
MMSGSTNKVAKINFNVRDKKVVQSSLYTAFIYLFIYLFVGGDLS